MGEMDPRVMLAMTLVSLGVTTVQKLRQVWSEHGVSESELDAIEAEVDRRLARRG
jgi:hypothetical protein